MRSVMVYTTLEHSLATRGLKATHPNWKGCKYNVLVDWETGEKTYEPLSVLAADDLVTCVPYAKENDLLLIDGWKMFRNLAKRDKT